MANSAEITVVNSETSPKEFPSEVSDSKANHYVFGNYAPGQSAEDPSENSVQQPNFTLNFGRRRGSLPGDQHLATPVTSMRRQSIVEMMNSGGLVINQRGSCEINLDQLPAQEVEMMYHYHGQPDAVKGSKSLETLDIHSVKINQSWWLPKFESPPLEKHLGKTVVEFLRTRFRVALLFISLFTLIWIVFFAVSIPFTASLPPDSFQAVARNTDLAIYSVKYEIWYVIGGAVLFGVVTILLMMTYAKCYRMVAVPLSIVLIVVLMSCSYALALALFFDSIVQGFLTMSYVAQFTITAVIILTIFMLSRMKIWVSLIFCVLYLLVLEAVLAVVTFAPHSDGKSQNQTENRALQTDVYVYSSVARVMFYICLNLVGVSSAYLSQIRQRITFWKIAQCVLSRKALELERELEEKTILSMMPKPFADILMEVQVQMAFMLKTKVGIDNNDASLDPLFQSITIPFNICSMNNVTILFADIVDFTRLSSSLSAPELVGVLNDVFSVFDDLVVKTNCEKISTLGDCYFCVSGCPKPELNHADNCVHMGLSIVDALEDFRKRTGLPIHMRIGVHTGSVFCGVMGTKRFKFDVWSKDVRTATKVESVGVADRVLISSSTRAFLSESYMFEEVSVPNGSSDLSGLRLYHVNRPVDPSTSTKAVTTAAQDDESDTFHSISARQSLSTEVTKKKTLCPFWKREEATVHIGRPLQENLKATSIVDIFSRQKQLQRCTSYAELPIPEPVNENNNKIVELMEEQKVSFDTYFDPQLHALHLHFHDTDLEDTYRNNGQDLDDGSNGVMAETSVGFQITKLSYMIDTTVLFINYLLITIGCLVCLSSDKTLTDVWPALLGVLLFGFIIYVVILIFVTAVFVPKLFPIKFAIFSLFIINWYARAIVALFMIYYPMTIVCVSIAQCETGFESVAELAHVQMAFFITILVLISSINFMDVSHLVKFVGGLLSGALAISMIVGVHMSLCIDEIPTNGTDMPKLLIQNGREIPTESPKSYIMTYYTRHVAPEAIVLMLLVLILLTVVNRMSEVSVRLSFMARIEASARRRLARIRKAQADWLLFNIIPVHVARQLRKTGKYSHNHECVGVIFASIVNFRDFQLKTPNSDEESLRVLNLIISEYDALLHRDQFQYIEKIKTIGSTYMAASGLSLNSTESCGVQHLLELIDFAENLITVLELINSQMPGFVFRMRIGFNYGPLTAGVVGSSKMLYDIWGDTVNVASRMDSTGLVNKIHMPELCLEKLSSFLSYETHKVVNVKGKGDMKTVFVKRGPTRTDMIPHRSM